MCSHADPCSREWERSDGNVGKESFNSNLYSKLITRSHQSDQTWSGGITEDSTSWKASCIVMRVEHEHTCIVVKVVMRSKAIKLTENAVHSFLSAECNEDSPW